MLISFSEKKSLNVKSLLSKNKSIKKWKIKSKMYKSPTATP